MSYRTHWDENGDETVELEGDFDLPSTYREREVALAFSNIVSGADRRELPVSRNVLHLAVQHVRFCTFGFGSKFKKDPRRFSSVPVGKVS